MDRINWGMIGCGNVTEIKSGPAFYKSDHSYLLAVMCRNINSARDYAFRHNIPNYFDEASLILNHPDIHAVYIATPVKYHAPYAIQAMEAGKAVYVEKPMALNYQQCFEMKEASDKTGSKLFVAYYRRSLDYFKQVKNLLKNDTIGKIESVSISLLKPARTEDYDNKNLPWRVMPELSGGGYFYDLACHQIDILQFLLGPILSAKGKTENRAGLYAAEDTVTAGMIFESGVQAMGNWSFVCKETEKKDEIIITGSKGSIAFSTFEFTPIRVEMDNNSLNYNYKTPQNIQMPFIQTIVNELTGRGKSDSDLNAAILTSKVIEDIIDSVF